LEYYVKRQGQEIKSRGIGGQGPINQTSKKAKWVGGVGGRRVCALEDCP